MTSLPSRRLVARFALAAALPLAIAVRHAPNDQTPAGEQPQDAKPQQDPTLEQRLTQLRKDLQSDPRGVAAAVRAIDLGKATAAERQQWLRVARDAAVRTGDRAWLAQLADEVDPFSEVWLYRVLLAGGHLAEGDLPAAKAELARIEDVEQVNERDKRRYFALQARIAQLEDDAPAEITALWRIVDELQHWPAKSCQGCHDDPKNKQVLPLLPVLDTWFAERLTAHLAKANDLGERLQRARQTLATAPDDTGARIHLAMLEQAAGDRDAAHKALEPIAWVALPGRAGSKPRMMTTYP